MYVHGGELLTVILSVHKFVTLQQKAICIYIAVRQCFAISYLKKKQTKNSALPPRLFLRLLLLATPYNKTPYSNTG